MLLRINVWGLIHTKIKSKCMFWCCNVVYYCVLRVTLCTISFCFQGESENELLGSQGRDLVVSELVRWWMESFCILPVLLILSCFWTSLKGASGWCFEPDRLFPWPMNLVNYEIIYRWILFHGKKVFWHDGKNVSFQNYQSINLHHMVTIYWCLKLHKEYL